MMSEMGGKGVKNRGEDMMICAGETAQNMFPMPNCIHLSNIYLLIKITTRRSQDMNINIYNE